MENNICQHLIYVTSVIIIFSIKLSPTYSNFDITIYYNELCDIPTAKLIERIKLYSYQLPSFKI